MPVAGDSGIIRVLGVDPGSETLGWGIVDGIGSKYRGVAFGTITHGSRIEFHKRLSKIYDDLNEIITRFQPQCVAVEDAFYSKNVKVAVRLGQVRGVVLLAGEKNGLPISEYAPRLVKKTVVGYGNAEKNQVQEMVRILLTLEESPKPHDAADALAIAICHSIHLGSTLRIKRALGGG